MAQQFLWGLLFIATFVHAQEQPQQQEQNVKRTIAIFFEGLHSGDTVLIKKVIHPEIKMQTTFFNKEGMPELRTASIQSFLNAVGSKKAEDKWFEKIQDYKIYIDTNLASVWTPYEFYLNDTFSHCGVNSFQMVELNGTWVITYLIDSRRTEGCK